MGPTQEDQNESASACRAGSRHQGLVTKGMALESGIGKAHKIARFQVRSENGARRNRLPAR
jgi:hypothetical protein